METSRIYDLLNSDALHKWRKTIIESEKESWFFTTAKESFDNLVKELNEQEKELLAKYSLAFENKLDYIYYNLTIKILNFGIKVGMELEKSFAEYRE